MDKRYNYELIKDYLDGLLDENTSREMAILIESDEVAASIAKGIIQLKERFEDDEELENYLSKLLNRNTSYGNSRSFMAKIAASILILFSIGYSVYFYMSNSLMKMVNSELSEPYDYALSVRTNNETTVFDEAMAYYNSRNYSEAANLLSEMNTPLAKFYYGISLVQLEKYDGAIQELQSPELMKTRFKDQAEWYAILCYVKLKQKDKAISILEPRLSNRTNFKLEEAKELLRLLNH